MIQIDPDVFTHPRSDDFPREAFVVCGEDVDGLFKAVDGARLRFQCVDETGAEHPDIDAAEAAYQSGLYTPNYCAQPAPHEDGVLGYVDCKGEIPDPMGETFRAILREELEAVVTDARVRSIYSLSME